MEQIRNVLPEMLATAVGLLIGWLWGTWRALAAWKKKEFRSNVVLSLNSLLPPTKENYKVSLKLRTLFERNLEDLLPNRAMQDLVQKAISKTTESDPILRFEKEDSWYILNAILNKIAEMYPEGSLKKDMGIGTESKWYVFCLTFERSGSMRIQKPRVMIMEKQKFLNFPEAHEVELEDPQRHTTRVETLKALKKDYRESPHLFLDMEIAF